MFFVVVFVKMADVNEKGELAVWGPLVWDSMVVPLSNPIPFIRES